ncbi:hypothetical protein OQJ19_12790 [Fluoribacter gormanii]|uniref:Uncharacterized protein n=1 Tax=Fluoribacter gormanii TaxID=464 RepID=A0A377GKR5_9GAMM|nr:hypothetical protein [Fluoribacter gormanii]KTD01857.1 hypothetical protein Lgor_2234 [Fluoribacter gormanii]MCW8471517.1 hypothetical protein [Fluoribacter gormanii]SIR23330.1 hypothetical protein SAMN05421777_108104 [Fluoribacter gormanii]STO25371.1 Uncharacterised protein [Fluoribacter gormanii]
MRKSLVSYLFFLITISYATLANSYGVHEDHPYDFVVTKDIYKFSEIYQIKSPQKDTYPGSVKKSAFRIRTNYDLSNKDGWQATGITRIISLGSLYPWAKEIDIYDTRGVQIGFIDGNLATLESAKFTIYDYDESGKSTEIGYAYANPSFDRFVILSSTSNPHPIAELNRNIGDKTWEVSVHYPEKIDDRIIRIFAGFVIDYEDKFLAGPDDSDDSDDDYIANQSAH